MSPSVDDRPGLEVRDLTVCFGGVTAVDGVSFTVRRGSILGLIGANGAGKTTIFDAICGFVPSTGGVLLAGAEINAFRPPKRARQGLGRSFQDGRLFPSLTVKEALAVSLERHTDRTGPINALIGVGPSRASERRIDQRVEELVELLNLGAFRDKFIGELSTGSRRIVDLAGAIGHSPEVLLLDEPSSGIAQRETEALGPMLLHIRQELGATILLIEHDMPLVTAVADELMALETGRIIAKGAPAAVLRDPTVVTAYLGGDESTIFRSGAVGGDESRRMLPADDYCQATTKAGMRCSRRARLRATTCGTHTPRT